MHSLNSSIQYFIALMKLPYHITLTPKIQIAKLPTDCRSLHMGNDPITIIGTGRYSMLKSPLNVQTTLRQAQFRTIPSIECKSLVGDEELEQRSIVCAKVANNQSAYDGDSGMENHRSQTMKIQIFLKVCCFSRRWSNHPTKRRHIDRSYGLFE